MSLSQFDDAYKSAASNPDSGTNTSEVPHGEYLVDVSSVELSEKDGKDFLKWKLRVIDGPFAGRTIRKTSIITENSIKYVYTDIKMCNLNIEKISSLEVPGVLERMFGQRLKIKKVAGKDSQYANVYFNENIGLEPTDNIETLPF
jgi:hypothetical protein